MGDRSSSPGAQIVSEAIIINSPSSATHPFLAGENSWTTRTGKKRSRPSSSPGHPRGDSDLYARAPRGMSTDELHKWAAQERKREAVPEKEREKGQLEAAPQYKHIPGLPWGDPASYAKASTAEEMEQAREALNKATAEKHEQGHSTRARRSATRTAGLRDKLLVNAVIGQVKARGYS